MEMFNKISLPRQMIRDAQEITLILHRVFYENKDENELREFVQILVKATPKLLMYLEKTDCYSGHFTLD